MFKKYSTSFQKKNPFYLTRNELFEPKTYWKQAKHQRNPMSPHN